MFPFFQGSQESVHRDMEGTAIMLESIPSVDGGGRSESTALVLDDQEASSSLEDEVQQNSGVKIVLVPHSCLHYHHSSRAGSSRSTGEGVLEEDEEEDADLEASTGLLARIDAHTCASSWDGVNISRGSAGSLNSSTGEKNRSGRGHKDSENSVEMEALIHPSGEKEEHINVKVKKDSANLQQSALNAECEDVKSPAK